MRGRALALELRLREHELALELAAAQGRVGLLLGVRRRELRDGLVVRLRQPLRLRLHAPDLLLAERRALRVGGAPLRVQALEVAALEPAQALVGPRAVRLERAVVFGLGDVERVLERRGPAVAELEPELALGPALVVERRAVDRGDAGRQQVARRGLDGGADLGRELLEGRGLRVEHRAHLRRELVHVPVRPRLVQNLLLHELRVRDLLHGGGRRRRWTALMRLSNRAASLTIQV